MKIIAFDISGKMAHFRKYYANNSAMSFTIPPRTALIGLLGAMLGKDRDSYYSDFSSEHLRIGVRLLSPVKKSVYRLNYLKLVSIGDLTKDNLGDFTGKEGHIQTPFEIVSGHNLTEDFVTYRVYLSANEGGHDVLAMIENALLDKRFVYNLVLGPANFPAFVEQVFQLEGKEVAVGNEYVSFHSAVPSSVITKLYAKDNALMSLEEELLPLDFKIGEYRELTGLSKFLFSCNGKAFKASVTRPYYQIEIDSEIENIFFLEK